MEREEELAKLFKDKKLEALTSLLNVFPDGADDDVLNLFGVKLEQPKDGEIFLFDLGITEQILYSIAEACKKKHELLMGLLKEEPFCEGCGGICTEELSDDDRDLLRRAMTYASLGSTFKSLFHVHLGNLIETAQVPSPKEKMSQGSSLALEVRSGFRLFGSPQPPSQHFFAIISGSEENMGESFDSPGAQDDDFEDLAMKAGVDISGKTFGKA